MQQTIFFNKFCVIKHIKRQKRSFVHFWISFGFKLHRLIKVPQMFALDEFPKSFRVPFRRGTPVWLADTSRLIMVLVRLGRAASLSACATSRFATLIMWILKASRALPVCIHNVTLLCVHGLPVQSQPPP